MRTNGSSQLLRTLQCGRKSQYVVDGTVLNTLPTMASGAAGTCAAYPSTLVAVATGAFVPPTASAIKVVGDSQTTNNSQIVVCSNSAMYGFNPGPATPQPLVSYFFASQGYSNSMAEILLESANLYWASSNANNSLRCAGWEDNI